MQTEASRPSNPMAIGSLLNESNEGASVLGVDRILDTQYAPHRDSHVEPTPRPRLRTRLTEPLPAVQMVPTANSPILQGWPLSPVFSATSDQSSSQNNMSPTMKRRASIARAPRPKYEEQQGFFIWYHRSKDSLRLVSIPTKIRERVRPIRLSELTFGSRLVRAMGSSHSRISISIRAKQAEGWIAMQILPHVRTMAG